MYITFDKETKVVSSPILEEKPLSFTNNLMVAEVESVPNKYDYLTVTNVREKTRVVKEAYEEIVEYDENGELLQEPIHIQHEAEIEVYYTCDLVANFRSQLTAEQLEKQKEIRYNNRVAQLVRLKYSQNDVEALLANYAEDKDKYQNEFDTFANYRKQCKTQAYNEIYK